MLISSGFVFGPRSLLVSIGECTLYYCKPAGKNDVEPIFFFILLLRRTTLGCQKNSGGHRKNLMSGPTKIFLLV